MSHRLFSGYFTYQEFSDFEAFAETFSDWSLYFRQLDRGLSAINTLRAACGGIFLGYGRFNRRYEQRNISPTGMRTFGLLSQWTTDVHWLDEEVTDQSLICYPCDRQVRAVSGPDFRVFTLTVPEALLIERAEKLGYAEIGALLKPDGNHFRIAGAELQRLRSYLRELCAYLLKNPERQISLDVIEDELLELLLMALASISAGESAARPCVRQLALRRALDYVEGHATSPLTVREISQVARVSTRTLEHAFREYYRVRPKTYLLALRLNGVRHELLAANAGSTSIHDVASRWGFWHMSQFALDYRKLFGELPSHTLHRLPNNYC